MRRRRRRTRVRRAGPARWTNAGLAAVRGVGWRSARATGVDRDQRSCPEGGANASRWRTVDRPSTRGRLGQTTDVCGFRSPAGRGGRADRDGRRGRVARLEWPAPGAGQPSAGGPGGRAVARIRSFHRKREGTRLWRREVCQAPRSPPFGVWRLAGPESVACVQCVMWRSESQEVAWGSSDARTRMVDFVAQKGESSQKIIFGQ